MARIGSIKRVGRRSISATLSRLSLALLLLAGTAVESAESVEQLLSPHVGKVVLVDFWASWCVPCRRSFPWMNSMQAKYAKDGLVIVAVNVDNDPEAAQKFLAEVPAHFQVRYDEDRSIAEALEVVAMPSSFLVGRDGHIVDQHLGFKVLKQDEYEAAIQAALYGE